MAIVDFPALVNLAADYFQQQVKMFVTSDGRIALIRPALEHQDEVDAAIRDNRITRGFLVESVFQVLDNGYGIAREEGRSEIDEYVVRKSMAKRCPYIMWC
jgi:hypothetical protein